MQMNDMILVSVDDHVCEPPHMWERHLSPQWQHRAPRLVTKEDGTNMWVTNQGDESVTEFSPATLGELNVLVSWNLPMVGPIAYGNGYLFAVSPPGSSPMVSQITPSPASVNWMMCNTNGPYLFNNPQAAVVAGTNLWVVNEGGNSLTEMDTVTGNLIRTVANP
jgi:DNA-binding beta-propeller fold protein YncE